MNLNFLFGRGKNSEVETQQADTPPPDRRQARLERRRRTDRRKDVQSNYKGEPKRETIDRRESVDERRGISSESEAQHLLDSTK